MHIIQGDLILHKRTLEPIKTVVYGLRRYDDDRVAAMSEKVDPSMKIQGYMSHKAKIRLNLPRQPSFKVDPKGWNQVRQNSHLNQSVERLS